MRRAANGPIRTCLACRRSRPKPDLIRLARLHGGVAVDSQGRLAGRGAYVCPRSGCAQALLGKRRGALLAALRLPPGAAPVDEDGLRAAIARRHDNSASPRGE